MTVQPQWTLVLTNENYNISATPSSLFSVYGNLNIHGVWRGILNHGAIVKFNGNFAHQICCFGVWISDMMLFKAEKCWVWPIVTLTPMTPALCILVSHSRWNNIAKHSYKSRDIFLTGSNFCSSRRQHYCVCEKHLYTNYCYFRTRHWCYINVIPITSLGCWNLFLSCAMLENYP